MWSVTSCISEIRNVSCSSPLSNKYFCRIPLKVAFPNLERQRFLLHDLLVSEAIWQSEHKKLTFFILTYQGILLKVRGWFKLAFSLDVLYMPLFAHLMFIWIPLRFKGSIEERKFELFLTSQFNVWPGPFWKLGLLYSSIENNESLDKTKKSTKNKDIMLKVEYILSSPSCYKLHLYSNNCLTTISYISCLFNNYLITKDNIFETWES